jgi:putative Holliday junction resolvase
MKILAIDHGRARTGLAVSDPSGTIVRPLQAIERVDTAKGSSRLDAVIAEEVPELILVGEPRHLSGERGEQAKRAAGFAKRLQKRVEVPVEMVDERMTTVEAGRRRAETGAKASLDSLAACVLLESYLGGSS